MSHWNHRVFRREWEDGTVLYGLHEVYYNDDGSIHGYTTEPVELQEETVEELREVLTRMQAALDAPVLVYDEVECSDPDWLTEDEGA